MSLDQELFAALEEHGARGRTALLTTGESVTYRGLGDRIGVAAAALAQLPSGSTVGISADKGVPLVVAMLGILRAGHCACVLEPGLTAASLTERAERFGITHVLADADRVTGLRAELGAVVLPLLDEVLGGVAEKLPWAAATAPALMLFTSGSTGTPKAIRLTRANLLAHARGVVTHTGLTPNDRLLHLMPLHHTNGVNNQILAPLLAGASVALVPKFRATEVEEQITRFRPTIITGVPTMYLRMLPHLETHRARPSLRLLRCGSAPLTAAQHDQIEAAFGVPLIQSYGLSEATCTSAMNPPGAPRRGTVGTVLPGQKIRILDLRTDQDAEPGREGEICIGGPTVMSGYVGETTGTGPVRDGLLHTGDLGTLDADGYLSVTGRLKDVIIRGGENLSPHAIESALTDHPEVTEAAVIGAPHHDLGEVPVAFVVPTDWSSPPEKEKLREYVRTALSRTHAPDNVHFVDALPVNGVGKVDKKALRNAESLCVPKTASM